MTSSSRHNISFYKFCFSSIWEYGHAMWCCTKINYPSIDCKINFYNYVSVIFSLRAETITSSWKSSFLNLKTTSKVRFTTSYKVQHHCIIFVPFHRKCIYNMFAIIIILFFDVITSIKSMESMECMYEKMSRNVTFSAIHRNTQIIVMW